MPTRLHQWRKSQGLTQDEVAALTGYSTPTICRLETGRHELRPLAKVRFARSLRVPLRDLFEFAEPSMVDEEDSLTMT